MRPVQALYSFPRIATLKNTWVVESGIAKKRGTTTGVGVVTMNRIDAFPVLGGRRLSRASTVEQMALRSAHSILAQGWQGTCLVPGPTCSFLIEARKVLLWARSRYREHYLHFTFRSAVVGFPDALAVSHQHLIR